MKVFVYGTLKNGYSNNFLMKGYESIEKCYVEGYKLYTNGFYPCAVNGNEEDIIYGEVFLYEKNQENILKKLDCLEGYDDSKKDLYKRIEIKAFTIYDSFQCYMYLYNRSVHGMEKLENFF